MNENDRNVDILLRRNVDQQLEEFDWEGLRRGIGSGLARTDATCRTRRLSGAWVAVAAVMALAAGLVVLAVIRSSGFESHDVVPGRADVAMIETTYAPGVARVWLLPAEKSGHCEVRILPSDRPRQEGGTKASWCIVVGQDSLAERYADGCDASDVACLF